MKEPHVGDLLYQVEKFLSDRIVVENDYLLPLSLWAAMTHCYEHCRFALPYLGIRADTAASGKSRLMEVLSTLCLRPRLFIDPSDAAIRNIIHNEHPTVGVDEAEEKLQSNSVLRQIFNSGYTPGGIIIRQRPDGTTNEYSTYCPKMYCMIADPVESLRTRSIMVLMAKGRPRIDDGMETYRHIGQRLAAHLGAVVHGEKVKIYSIYHDSRSLKQQQLHPRDMQIWRPLLTLCKVLVPSRMGELENASVYLSALKSHPRHRFADSARRETEVMTMQYAVWLLEDVLKVMGDKPKLSTEALIRGLMVLPGKRWVGFRYINSQGEGVRIDNSNTGQQAFATLIKLASNSSVSSDTMRIGGQLAKGYSRSAVEKALADLQTS